MKLTFLGAGSAFTLDPNNYQSNLLLMGDRDRNLLIDCGSDIRFSLRDIGRSYTDVTDIYISHLHADHVGGLEFMGLSAQFDPNCPQPKLYLPECLVEDLWERSLCGGMRSLQGKTATLDTYFKTCPVPNRGTFVWEGKSFQLVPTVHIVDDREVVESFGLFFELDGTKIFLTTDTQFCPDRLRTFYEKADIIFHDCETAPFKSTVHSHYEELLTLPASIRRKMWLYHYQAGPLPDARQAGFLGFVRRGQSFQFAEVTAPVAAIGC